MTQKICKNCEWFEEVVLYQSGQVANFDGWCVRYPPWTHNGDYMFPATDFTERCGEYHEVQDV